MTSHCSFPACRKLQAKPGVSPSPPPPCGDGFYTVLGPQHLIFTGIFDQYMEAPFMDQKPLLNLLNHLSISLFFLYKKNPFKVVTFTLYL